ncbi:MAG: response regulator transcription factor [Clostridia bacterium]|nr:response regulator transcription factor [Clostridia bacterium]
MIKTVIIEDDPVIGKYLEDALLSDGRFEVLSVLPDAFDAEAFCLKERPALVLMDVRTLHNHSGLSVGERLKKSGLSAKIIAVTSLIDPEVLMRAKSGAADSLCYKDAGEKELISVIDRTLAGERVFPSSSPSVELKDMFSGDITPRQMDVLRRFIRGMTYDEIARDLNISKPGVRKILDTLIEKGGFANKYELMIAAVENKLIVTTLHDK